MGSKYAFIAGDLERSFARRVSSGSSRLPGEAELCREYGCSRQTVRAALSALERAGKIIKVKGSGSYIAANSARRRIVLILPGENEYIFPDIRHAAEQYCADIKLEFSFWNSENKILKERGLLSSLLQAPPAGVLFYPAGPAFHLVNNDLLQQLADEGVPVVCLKQSELSGAALLTAAADVEAGSCAMALQLRENRDRGLTAVLPVSSPDSVSQFRGLLRAAPETGFQESSVLWLSDLQLTELQNHNYGAIASELRKLVRPGGAVFCGNDEIAYHVIRLLGAAGLSVPRDVAVSGFDNSYYCTVASPAITSVGTEPDEVIRAAFQLLLLKITGREAESVLIPMRITERRSTAGDRR